jgi:hypothetical protein
MAALAPGRDRAEHDGACRRGTARRCGERRWPRSRVQGHPLRTPARGSEALAAAAATAAVGRRAARRELRSEVSAIPGPRQFALRRRPRTPKRGLPVAERLDGGRDDRRASPGDGLVPSRRLPVRRRLGAALRRGAARTRRRGRGHRQPPPGPARLPRAPRAERRVRASDIGQLRHPRPDSGAPLARRERRGVRWGPGPRDDLRALGGIDERQHADGLAARARPVPSRDQAERGVAGSRRSQLRHHRLDAGSAACRADRSCAREEPRRPHGRGAAPAAGRGADAGDRSRRGTIAGRSTPSTPPSVAAAWTRASRSSTAICCRRARSRSSATAARPRCR